MNQTEQMKGDAMNDLCREKEIETRAKIEIEIIKLGRTIIISLAVIAACVFGTIAVIAMKNYLSTQSERCMHMNQPGSEFHVTNAHYATWEAAYQSLGIQDMAQSIQSEILFQPAGKIATGFVSAHGDWRQELILSKKEFLPSGPLVYAYTSLGKQGE